ncbi:MAG: YkgJ family cysteine cluster protein [Verrucomicrobiae bacterium]|nr:YkgJ family cysteine cluster protein [Verrucomicrobiae bacterium]
MDTAFNAPPNQLYECRDCPARCCRMPWAIRLGDDEAGRIGSNEWARSRMAEMGAELRRDRSGARVLPMIDRDRHLQCVFLDDDGLCGLHKRSGHAFIPAVCQAFPFEFIRDERGQVTPILSHLCPSIRDNYGKPIGDVLADKLAQSGGRAPEMAPALPLAGGPVISRSRIAAIARRWEERLSDGAPIPQILADLYDELDLLRAALAREGIARGPVGDDAFDRAWAAALESAKPEPLPKTDAAPPIANVLFALCLSLIAYPARVQMSHRVRRPGERAPSLLDTLSLKLRMVLGQGEADLLFIDRPFPLERVPRVARFLSTGAAATARSFLVRAIARRALFRGDADLQECLFTLGLGASLISRFARCRAASEGRASVDDRDVREGISAAELVLFTHARLLSGSALTRLILRGLAGNRLSYRNVLVAEA